MLSSEHRLTKSVDFRRTIRSGRAIRLETVIVYGRLSSETGEDPKVGITVSKSVGGSVVRHRVARWIRHAARDALTDLPQDSAWVIRALPAAGDKGARRQVREDVLSGLHEIVGK